MSEYQCPTEREVRIYTYHRITLFRSTIDGIDRLHLLCKDCSKSICMTGKLKDYREGQIIKTLHGGEV